MTRFWHYWPNKYALEYNVNHTTLDLLLAGACAAAAMAVAALCGLGLLVWLAGGRLPGQDGPRLKSKTGLPRP